MAGIDALPTNGNTTVNPARIRPALVSVVAASVDEIQRALLEAALGAPRPHWISHECTGCGQKERLEVLVPDVRSRVAAIELLLREGLGRPPQSQESSIPKLPTDVQAVKRMGWKDLQVLSLRPSRAKSTPS